MKCARCNADNNTSRKYCTSCGAPMGVICDRCGVVNDFEDKYCGVCGFALIQSPKPEVGSAAPQGVPDSLDLGQYTERDIEELMALRKKMKKEEDSTESLRQDDINKLFG